MCPTCERNCWAPAAIFSGDALRTESLMKPTLRLKNHRISSSDVVRSLDPRPSKSLSSLPADSEERQAALEFPPVEKPLPALLRLQSERTAARTRRATPPATGRESSKRHFADSR